MRSFKFVLVTLLLTAGQSLRAEDALPEKQFHVFITPLTSFLIRQLPPVGIEFGTSDQLSLGTKFTYGEPGAIIWSVEGTYWWNAPRFSTGWGTTPFVAWWSADNFVTVGALISHHWCYESGFAMSLGGGLSHIFGAESNEVLSGTPWTDAVGPEVSFRIGWMF